MQYNNIDIYEYKQWNSELDDGPVFDRIDTKRQEESTKRMTEWEWCEWLTARGQTAALSQVPEVLEPGQLEEDGARLQGDLTHSATVLVPQPPRPLVPLHSLLHLDVSQLNSHTQHRDTAEGDTIGMTIFRHFSDGISFAWKLNRLNNNFCFFFCHSCTVIEDNSK